MTLTWANIEDFVKTGAVESEVLEFKQEPPSRSEGKPGWDPATGIISDYARNALLEEVIAFANGVGGMLVIGIEESADLPHRATSIRPFEGVHLFAQRLSHQIRDCVEPGLHTTIVTAVSSGQSTTGVAVVSIGASLSAPHRLKVSGSTKDGFVRRNDRCETMTMREIQDLTISRRTATARLAGRQERASSDWIQALRRHGAAYPSEVSLGLRVYCTPTTELLELKEVDTIKELYLPQRIPQFQYKTRIANADFPGMGWTPTYILGGMRFRSGDGNEVLYRDIYRNGNVQYTYFTPAAAAKPTLYLTWVVYLLANALAEVDLVRRAGEAPASEYAVQLGIACNSARLFLGELGGAQIGSPSHLSDLPSEFGPYSFTDTASLSALIGYALRDLMNAAGKPFRAEEFALQ